MDHRRRPIHRDDLPGGVRMISFYDPRTAWYVARAAGLVAWAVVTASMAFGLTLSTRLVRRRGAPAYLLDLHRFLGTLTVVFVTVHIAALWADSFLYFGPSEIFVPMASTWRPVAVAWGIVGLYLLAAIQTTSWAMRHLPRRIWHGVHMASYALFISATAHGFLSGTDRGNLAVQWLALTGGMIVVFLIVFRVVGPRRRGLRGPTHVTRGESPSTRRAEPGSQRQGGLRLAPETTDANAVHDEPEAMRTSSAS
jgi:predicted ferric reductase